MGLNCVKVSKRSAFKDSSLNEAVGFRGLGF